LKKGVFPLARKREIQRKKTKEPEGTEKRGRGQKRRKVSELTTNNEKRKNREEKKKPKFHGWKKFRE